MNTAMGRVKNSQAYQSHSIPHSSSNISHSRSAHLFVHLVKWEKKHSCTDFKQTKRKKRKKKITLSFLAEQECAVNTWRLKIQKWMWNEPVCLSGSSLLLCFSLPVFCLMFVSVMVILPNKHTHGCENSIAKKKKKSKNPSYWYTRFVYVF